MESKTLADVKLNPQQSRALQLMLQGENVLITGPSGTGKSLVIREFQQQINRRRNVAITSTTGISALLVGGTTLHSYLGIGLGQDTVANLEKKIRYSKKVERWTKLDILIIDEVSMLAPDLFDRLEELARVIRRNDRPFGGIQLILSGDFLQLPVVNSAKFCFEAEKWATCVNNIVHLTEIVRQGDIEFQTVLNDLRFGQVTPRAKQLLRSRIGAKLNCPFGIRPTRIYTTNMSVDQYNEIELDKLSKSGAEFYQYDMEIYFYNPEKNKMDLLDKYRKNCLCPSTLQLCVGAQVMLVCNLDLDSGLANGSLGIITEFREDLPVVKFTNGEERIIHFHAWEIEEMGQKMVRISQIPLRIAYAITCHKSQGATIDLAEIDLSNVFEYGQAYVALSRVRTKEGLSLINIDFKTIQAHPDAIRFYYRTGGHIEEGSTA